MIINEQKVNETKNEIKILSDNLNTLSSKSELETSYKAMYEFLKKCSSFSHLLISLANYKELREMLGNWTNSDNLAFVTIKSILFANMKGTEEERLINAIEYLKD